MEGGECVCIDGSAREDGKCPPPKGCDDIYCGFYATCSIGISSMMTYYIRKAVNPLKLLPSTFYRWLMSDYKYLDV
jgi:hypothetical protein